MLNGLTPEQQALREFDREHGLRSTFYLGRRILGYQFDERPHKGICNFIDVSDAAQERANAAAAAATTAPPEFKETADRIARELAMEAAREKARLLLDPRGCYKTSIVSQAYPTRRIIKNPNIRILLDSVALTNSQDNLKVIRRFFEGNEKVRELYGDFISHDQAWNDTEFIVSKRTNSRLKEPTVRASGIDKIQIGPHYDLIIADDLHNRDNCKSLEQVAKVKEHIRLLFGLLEPGGEIIIAGHRWSYKDAFSMVMGDTDKPEELEFAKHFRGNTYVHSAVYPDGSLYFPRVLTHEHLDRQRSSLGYEMYAAMLMNEPAVTGADQKFDPRYFKRYKEPLQTRDAISRNWFPKMNWYLRIDPGGRKKGNNYWVLFEGALSPEGSWYFTRYLKKVSKTTIAAEDIYRWWQQRLKDGTPYRNIGFEVSGQQGQMLDSMKDYLWDRYKVQLPFIELAHSDDSKDGRIEALAPLYENGKIFHSELMSAPFGLVDQLVKYTKAEDDVADAASMLLEGTRAPKVIIAKPEPANLNEMIVRNIEERFSGKTKITRSHPILGSDY